VPTTRIQNVTVTDNVTLVKKVVVGRPVRRVNTATAGSIDTLSGVDTTSKQDGSVLVYQTNSGNWEATQTLEQQIINGGQY